MNKINSQIYSHLDFASGDLAMVISRLRAARQLSTNEDDKEILTKAIHSACQVEQTISIKAAQIKRG